jgi:hypothetical protein
MLVSRVAIVRRHLPLFVLLRIVLPATIAWRARYLYHVVPARMSVPLDLGKLLRV